MDDLIPAVPMVRVAADELAEPTLPRGVAHVADAGGGGAPSGADEELTCPPISPAENLPDPLTPDRMGSADDVVLLELKEADEAESQRRMSSEFVDYPVRWNGEPTKSALKALALEARTPGFDVAEATGLLRLMMDDGLTLVKACEALGVKRSTALAWARLVPAFGDLLEEAKVSLGGFQLDKAVADLDGGDPQVASARLKLAAAYDRRIAKGEDSAATVGIVVQVNR